MLNSKAMWPRLDQTEKGKWQSRDSIFHVICHFPCAFATFIKHITSQLCNFVEYEMSFSSLRLLSDYAFYIRASFLVTSCRFFINSMHSIFDQRVIRRHCLTEFPQAPSTVWRIFSSSQRQNSLFNIPYRGGGVQAHPPCQEGAWIQRTLVGTVTLVHRAIAVSN